MEPAIADRKFIENNYLPTNVDIRKMNRPPEQTVITNWICDRIRRGLGVNIIVVGPPGVGKSYTCLRLMEDCLQNLYGENLENPKGHIVDNIPDVFNFIRHVKRPGMPLTIEEVSVMASSRRSMASDNVSLNAALDTVRKKQVILLMNAPAIQAVDSHIKRMSHLLIECLRVNRRKGFATIKALKLQHNQHSGKVYTHRFNVNGRDVHRSVIYKPTALVCKLYEEKKDEFMSKLYELMELKAAVRRKKLEKEAGAFKPKGKPSELTPKQKHAYRLYKEGNNFTECGRILGISEVAARYLVRRAEKALKDGAKHPEKGGSEGSKSGKSSQ